MAKKKTQTKPNEDMAASEPCDSDMPVAALTWDVLWERTQLMFTDADVDSYHRRLETAAKKLKRAGLEAPPVDLAACRAAMVEYASTLQYKKSLRKNGVSAADFVTAKDLCPELAMVLEFVRKVRDEYQDAENEEVGESAKKTLVISAKGGEVPKGAITSAMFLLGHIDHKRFGDNRGTKLPSEDEEHRMLGNTGKGGILIHVVGDAAAKFAEPQQIGGKAGGVFIDV